MVAEVGLKPLDGRVGLVTGGGSGIGKCVALQIAASGATVVVVGRRESVLRDAVQQAGSAASRVVPHAADITSEEDVRGLSERIQREYGRLDILVHSAGVIRFSGFDRASADDLAAQYRTNVHAPFALTQTLLPLLKRAQGQVVFMNSSVGLNARAGCVPYAATKHALRAIADGLRQEVNQDGIRVLSLFLGRTASAMQESMHEFEGAQYRPDRLLQPDDVAAVVLCALQLARSAEITDISIRPMKKN